VLIRSHHLPLLAATLREAAERYREAFGSRSPAAAMFRDLAALVTRGGRIDLDETPDERPQRRKPG
jgi:hypothetical protein